MNELVFVLSGDPSRGRSKDEPNLTILYALIAFALLSWLNKKYNKDDKMKKDEFEKWKSEVSSKQI
ncbi:hypothetical protein KXQ82_15830 [Mucilaginibacter sp. HMF5004]|uniref:hypothetical protein n=1 Tax=Mucilaginibacter rivuli TaxID=2857527 RepID=UPI001C5EBD39|nr:hypothetical protein [Mucilaginibacter rivuli]MBW4891196.1 hypothetical protein [Mucilaginibacter rivuli]